MSCPKKQFLPWHFHLTCLAKEQKDNYTSNRFFSIIAGGWRVGIKHTCVQVTYVECSSRTRPPRGCTQYLTGISGRLQVEWKIIWIFGKVLADRWAFNCYLISRPTTSRDSRPTTWTATFTGACDIFKLCRITFFLKEINLQHLPAPGEGLLQRALRPPAGSRGLFPPQWPGALCNMVLYLWIVKKCIGVKSAGGHRGSQISLPLSSPFFLLLQEFGNPPQVGARNGQNCFNDYALIPRWN